MVFVSTVALAEWLATGTGEGYARALEAQPLTTESTEVTGDLYPGGTGDLVVRIRNPNPFPVTVISISQLGEITSDTAGCDATNHGVTFEPPAELSLAIPADGAATHVLADTVSMASTSADACQGALFTIPLSLNGGTDSGAGGGGGPGGNCNDNDPTTVDIDNGDGTCTYEPAP